MKRYRRLVSTNQMVRVALTSLATMTLTFPAACWSDDAAATGPAAPASEVAAKPAGADAAAPRVLRHGPVRHLTIAQSIDESVRRLARGLDLDPGQQVRLRQILVDQHRQMMKLRSGASGVSGDVTGTMLAIYDQTRARIRAMLNDEQLKKYPAAVPRDQTAPAQADLQHWMQLQETKRKQDAEVSQ